MNVSHGAIGAGVWLISLLIAEILSGLEIFCESMTHAETKITPSISASERYDSNVWRSPSRFLPPGTKLWDMVTGLSPQVEFVNKSGFGDTKFNAGVSGSIFVNNPSLNYISTNVGLNSDLTGWIRDIIPGARLRVSDSFLYTPEPPGFITGVKPQDPTDTFARGVVASCQHVYELCHARGNVYIYANFWDSSKLYKFNLQGRPGLSSRVQYAIPKPLF